MSVKFLIIAGTIFLLLMFGRRTKQQQSSEFESGAEWYQRMLLDPRWIRKRDRILERDDYTCQRCDSKENLCVHHRRYNGRPWEVPDGWLVTLCEDCHEEVHSYRY